MALPPPSSTLAPTFTSSTPLPSSTSPACVTPSPTPEHVASSNVAKPSAKPIEGTAPKPVENVLQKPAPKSSAQPDHVEAPKPSANPSHVPAPKPATESPTPKPETAKPQLGSSGSQWCMTYSPYNGDGSCKSSAAVSSDVEAIASKGFSSIRLYSTDCSGLQNVGSAAKSHGLKLVLGVFISGTGLGDASAQIAEITAWAGGDWACVEMIVVGNEAIFNNYYSASALADFITQARATFAAAGYRGPITTTEPLNVLTDNAHHLCPVLDVAAANIHPFFNADVTAAGAGAFVARELELLETICPGLTGYNLETGWPSAGLANGAAVPGVSEQLVAIESIKQAAGGKSAFFSFVDDLWKAEGELRV